MFIYQLIEVLTFIDSFVCSSSIRDKHAPLSQIRLSLVTSLFAGQITFLAGIDATENKVSNFLNFFFTYYKVKS